MSDNKLLLIKGPISTMLLLNVFTLVWIKITRLESFHLWRLNHSDEAPGGVRSLLAWIWISCLQAHDFNTSFQIEGRL